MVELFLDGSLIDLYEDNGITLNIFNSELDKFVSGSTKGTFSYDITIPATKNNKKLLYFPELILDESFDDSTEKEALLQIDGNVVLNGYARIKSTVIDNEIINYSIVLHEGNGSWIGNIKDKSIREINYKEYNHIFNKANQIESEVHKAGQLVTYPVINFGRPEKGEDHWSVEDRYPAFNVSKVFRDIFKEAGYFVSSDFIDSDFFKKLWFTCSERPKRRQEDLDPHKFKVLNGVLDLVVDGTDFTFQQYKTVKCIYDENTTLSNTWYEEDTSRQYTVDLFAYNTELSEYNLESTPTQGHYEASFNGRMSFTMNYSFLHVKGISGGQLSVTIALMRSRLSPDGTRRISSAIETREVTVVKPSGLITLSGFGSLFPINQSGIFTSNAVEVSAGETYYFAVKMNDNGNYGNNQSLTFTAKTITNKVYDTVTDGAPLYVEDVLPDIKQKEFITDLRTMFNLYFYTDEISKTIYIEPRDQFYTDDTEDWTFKHDRSKPTTISHLGSGIAKEITFAYNVDSSDKYIRTREEASNDGEKWLSRTVGNTNKSAPEGTTEKRVKNFAPTFVGKGIITSNDARIPIVWNGLTKDMPETKVQKWDSRILYYKGRTPLGSNDYFKFEGEELKYYPEFTINYVSAVNSHQNSLDFNDTRWSTGLYYKHWQKTINTINESRKVDMYMKLTTTDIQNLDFRKPKYISNEGDGNYYHLEKIHNYTINNVGVYKCSFIKAITGSPLVEILNSPSNEVTPPYIKDEFIQDDISQEITPQEISVVMTQSVWMSTIDNPSGEFVDVEYDVFCHKVDANRNLLNRGKKVIINE